MYVAGVGIVWRAFWIDGAKRVGISSELLSVESLRLAMPGVNRPRLKDEENLRSFCFPEVAR